MNKTAIAGVLIAVLAVFGGWQYLQAGNLQSDLDVLQNSHNKLLKEHQEQIDQLNKAITRLERELRDAQSQVNLSKGEKSGDDADPKSGNKVATTVGQGRGGALQNMIMQQLNNPQARNALAQLSYTQRYGAFIQSLKLSPSVEAALKEKIMAVITKQLEMQQKLASGQISREEMSAFSADKEIASIMAATLTREQMAGFSAFEAGAPARAAAQVQTAITMQLAMQAPGLTPQNQSVVASALAKAMTNPAIAANARAGGQNPMGKMLEDVEYSLQGTMDDDQMKIARDFLRQRSQLLNVMGQ